MKCNNFASATLRTVIRENINNISTLQFNDFNEALEHLVVGDRVLAFHNGGRYIMKIYSLDKECIACADDVGIVQFRKNSRWISNGLERIRYD